MNSILFRITDIINSNRCSIILQLLFRNISYAVYLFQIIIAFLFFPALQGKLSKACQERDPCLFLIDGAGGISFLCMCYFILFLCIVILSFPHFDAISVRVKILFKFNLRLKKHILIKFTGTKKCCCLCGIEAKGQEETWCTSELFHISNSLNQFPCLCLLIYMNFKKKKPEPMSP